MRNLILFIALVAVLSSCKNLVPYTDAMKSKYGWSDEQVKKIQFYVSDDIVLHRELKHGSTEIVQGKIKTVNGKEVEEILIRQGTPGVLIEIPREKKMLVSFEVSDSHYLSFGVNPNMSDKYTLLASDWNAGMGMVHYSDKEYYTDPDSKYSYLLVDLRRIQKLDLKQRVAKGRRIQ